MPSMHELETAQSEQLLRSQRIGRICLTTLPGVEVVPVAPPDRGVGTVDAVDLDAARFARTGGRAVIGSPSQLHDLVDGLAGPQVVDFSASHHERPLLQRLGG